MASQFDEGWKVVKKADLVLDAAFDKSLNLPPMAVIFGQKYGSGKNVSYPVVVELADTRRIRLATMTFTVDPKVPGKVNYTSETNTRDSKIDTLEGGNPLNNDNRVRDLAEQVVQILRDQGRLVTDDTQTVH